MAIQFSVDTCTLLDIMSIFFDFHVGPTGRKFRRAIDFDKHEIELILDRKHIESIFGQVNIGELIELAHLSICLINEDKKVIGFLALHDRLNVPAVPACDWESWIRNMFQCHFLPHNTLFIHMMCCAEAENESFLDEALKSVFNNDEYLLQVVLVAPPSCTHEDFARYKPFRNHTIKKIPTRREDGGHGMFVARREDFYPRLSVRAAVEEDNDDIVELLDKLHPSMKKLYGDYYVSEIIGRHPESQRKIVVAQRQESQAVGVMCLNASIDYDHLSKTYDLTPFFGLTQATALEREEFTRTNSTLLTFGDPIMRGKRSPFDNSVELSGHQSPEVSRRKRRQRKMSSHVIFKSSTAMKRSFDHFFKKRLLDDNENIYISPTNTSIGTEVCMRPSVSVVLDEDPFDYEIVNIEASWLQIPRVLSTQHSETSLLVDMTENDKAKRSSSVSKFKSFKKRAKLQQMKKDGKMKAEYRGKPNAFSIEIYALQDNIDERKGYDLLTAAFEVMTGYDYCLLRIPCDCSPMSLLRHFCLIPFKNKVCSEYALYIAHRSSVLGNLTVRKAEIVDIPQISKFLQNLDGKETMWVVENSIMGRNQHEVYVFLCGVNVIGFGVLEPPEQLNYLQTRFNMDPYRIRNYHRAGQGPYTGFSDIKTTLVYPVFEVHFRFFLREMMRQSGADTLIWLTAYKYKWVIHKANSMVAAMVPLMPRKSEPTCALITEMEKMRRLSRNIMAFSTWIITSKLTSVCRLNIDTRIVVVGCSRTALGFINSLLFSDASTYLTFTNVTLISTSGLPFTRHCHADYAHMMFLQHRTTTENYLKSTPYTYYLNVVQASVVEINKQDKYVDTSIDQRYYYDKLFLMFGKQFQHPDYLQEVKDQELAVKAGTKPYIRLDDPSFRIPEIATIYNTPRNVFIINSMNDAHRALRQVRNIRRKASYDKIIVYGLALETYCCIAALLEMGIPNNKIVFVEPFPPENRSETRVPVFNNTYVDQTLKEVFDELEIEVLRSYYFQSWKTDIYNAITHATFLSHFQMVDVPCTALFYYGSREIDADGFLAIHKSGLVYNDGIIINHECRTNNPSIYAAGPATRYCARYFAEMRDHRYYDSYEIGRKLGTEIRNELDPLFSEKKSEFKNPMRYSTKSVSFDSSPGSAGPSVDNCSNIPRGSKVRSDDLEKLPVYANPIVTHCVLPGGLQYLDVWSPGRKIPHPFVQSLGFNGFVMETFKSGYFKLHMNKDFVVDGITCLSPVKYSIAYYTALYGKSALLLNNVHIKYTAKKVDNFYEFFNSRGIMYLYHEHVDKLFFMVKELLPLNKPDGETLTETMQQRQQVFNERNSASIRSEFKKSQHVEAITAYVLEWLSQCDLMLPEYYQPWQRPYFMRDLALHPYFDNTSESPMSSSSKISTC